MYFSTLATAPGSQSLVNHRKILHLYMLPKRRYQHLDALVICVSSASQNAPRQRDAVRIEGPR